MRAMVRPLKHGTGGFSLVEMMFGVGILGFILAGLLSFLVEFSTLNKLSRDLTFVTSHAQYVLEDIRSSSGVIINQIDAGEWDLNTDAEYAAAGLQRLSGEVVDVSHNNASPLTITVNITWNQENGRATSQTFYTIDAGI